MGATAYRAMKVISLFAMALFLLNALSPAALAADHADKLTFTIEPYIWLPTIDAEMKFTTPGGSTGEPEVSVNPDDYFKDLEIAALLTTEFRKGKWSLTADFVYMDVSSSDSSVKSIDFGGSVVSTSRDIGSEVDLKNFIATFGGGYQIIDQGWLKMDLIAGLRYLWLEAELDWNLSATVSGPLPGQTFARTGNHTEDEDIWNGIVGVRGQVKLGESHWFIPYYLDIGTGDSDLTWQAFSALAYSFGSWDVVLGYRYLEFDSDEDALIQELSLSGPVIGARFSF